jgi:apolipoprotein N-acyltransferase
MTLLWRNPNRSEPWLKWLRLDSVMMIAVTGIVYNILLGPAYPPVGLNKISSPIEHTITPLITVIVFFAFGPRGWFSWSNIGKALLIPIGYVIYTLIRGVIIGMYPYGFFDVVVNGYVGVLSFVGAILVASLVVMLIFWAIERAVSNRRS